MIRLYNAMPDDKFKKITGDKFKYKKLVFALSWLHSVIIERRRFKTLGWNVIYDFNDSDWDTSDKILEIGTGSMYQATVLAEMGAKVYTIERQKALFEKTKHFVFQKTKK